MAGRKAQTDPSLEELRPNAKQIADWKKKYGNVLHKFQSSDGRMVIMREPTPAEMEDGLAKFSKLTREMKANGNEPKHFDFKRQIFQVIKLYADPGTTDDSVYMQEVYLNMDELVKSVEGKVEKL